MVRLTDLHPDDAAHMLAKRCPEVGEGRWVAPPPSARARVALLTTAGIHLKSDRSFSSADTSFRLFERELDLSEVRMSHTSVNFDRSGYQEDPNVVFPLDRFRELEQRGEIGSLADFHYAFMGALSEPEAYAQDGKRVASAMLNEGVNVAFLTPV